MSGSAFGASDFTSDGLYWYNGFGGAPNAVSDPSGGIAYADVTNLGRVMRVTSFATYLQQKAVIRPTLGRRYRFTVEVRAQADASGGSLSAELTFNGLDTSWNHGGPNTTVVTAAGYAGSATLTVAGGWQTLAVEFYLSSAGTYDAAWRPRLDLNRSAGSGGAIDVRKFLLEDITDINATNAQVATNSSAIATETSARASADTTLTASVGTLTSSVATNASAIATVDGKLSASYGLTVDSNGRIASMKLLSDGSTSTVKFVASTFQIYNGTTDEAPFEVVSGVVKIKSANVGTLNVGSGGITIQSGSSGARTVIGNSVVEVYDESNVRRVRMGVW